MEDSLATVARAHSELPWEPIVVNRAAHDGGRLLKIVAFNARGGWHLDEIAARLKRPPLSNPDIVLLSEMDWRLRRSGRRETAAELAAELGMSFAYGAEFGIPRTSGEPISFMGNAILSSRQLSDVRMVPLGKRFVRKRVRWLLGLQAGLVARITVNRRTIALGVVHLNSRWNPSGRESQMKQFLEGFPSDHAAVLGGDFNTTTVDLRTPSSLIKVMALSLAHSRRFRYPERWEPLFQRIREAGFETNTPNVPGSATFTPTRFMPPFVRPKLDWLALRGLKAAPGSAMVVPARASLLSRRFSDHDFIMAVVHM
jgi:endonuclease/exonuclease/phosphatase family metal-dependent hydrolase